MATITAHVDDTSLSLTAPSASLLTVPITPPPCPATKLRVCGDNCRGSMYGKDASEWLSGVLGRPCHLVKRREGKLRSGAARSFANEGQILMLTSATIGDVTRRVDPAREPHDQRTRFNFRPNLVVGGSQQPYLEDRWSKIQIGRDVKLTKTGPCTRCHMVNIDDQTGEVHKEPLRTLAKYRRVKGRIFLGMLLSGDARKGDHKTIVCVGDKVLPN